MEISAQDISQIPFQRGKIKSPHPYKDQRCNPSENDQKRRETPHGGSPGIISRPGTDEKSGFRYRIFPANFWQGCSTNRNNNQAEKRDNTAAPITTPTCSSRLLILSR
jgi:hypothetical protein